MNYISNLEVSPYLQHYGVLGMKWGVRRYQNADGSLTAAGKKRYDQLESQAAKYDQSASSYSKKAKTARAHYEDIKKNGKNSKYYERYVNPDDEDELESSRNSAKLDAELYADHAKKDREIAENIRNTKYGQKSIVEISNRKDTISKGASAALLVGGTAVSVVLASKGVISKGQAALGIAASGFVAGHTRLNTFGSVYDELKKSNSK